MKKGYFEIYFLIIFSILIFITSVALNISFNGFKSRIDLEKKLQAQYYAESGINHAKKMLQNEKYPTSNKKYYLIIEKNDIVNTSSSNGDEYIQISIDCTLGSNFIKYQIYSTARIVDYYYYLSKELIVLK